jgi:hypothetical protein
LWIGTSVGKGNISGDRIPGSLDLVDNKGLGITSCICILASSDGVTRSRRRNRRDRSLWIGTSVGKGNISGDRIPGSLDLVDNKGLKGLRKCICIPASSDGVTRSRRRNRTDSRIWNGKKSVGKGNISGDRIPGSLDLVDNKGLKGLVITSCIYRASSDGVTRSRRRNRSDTRIGTGTSVGKVNISGDRIPGSLDLVDNKGLR